MTTSSQYAIFNIANIMIGIAKTAYERAKASANNDRAIVNGDPVVAIVFAAAAGEAFINEIAEMAPMKFGHLPELGNAPDQIDSLGRLLDETERSKGTTKLKYMVAKVALTGKSYDKGLPPFQDFSLLMDLRNALMHMQLDRINSVEPAKVDIQYPAVVSKLRSKAILAVVEGDDTNNAIVSWLSRVSTPAAARWACNTTAAIVKDVADSIPDGDLKQVTDLMYYSVGSFSPVV